MDEQKMDFVEMECDSTTSPLGDCLETSIATDTEIVEPDTIMTNETVIIEGAPVDEITEASDELAETTESDTLE